MIRKRAEPDMAEPRAVNNSPRGSYRNEDLERTFQGLQTAKNKYLTQIRYGCSAGWQIKVWSKLANLQKLSQWAPKRRRKTLSTWQGTQGCCCPPSPCYEAIHLSTQKGKTLEEGPDTRGGYNSFSCIVVIETFSIVVFFAFISFLFYIN